MKHLLILGGSLVYLAVPSCTRKTDLAPPNAVVANKNLEMAGNNAATPPVGVPEYLGYSVASQVDDVRESVHDLLTSLENAGEGFGYENWQSAEAIFKRIDTNVSELKEKLNAHYVTTNNTTWGTYVNTPDYAANIQDSVNKIGGSLQELSEVMGSGAAKTKAIPLAVANGVVNQVEDVRESIEDLVETLKDSGDQFSYYDWTADRDNLSKYEERLDQLKKKLQRKEDKADSEWTAWFGADVYKVTVHESLGEMAGIMKGLASSIKKG